MIGIYAIKNTINNHIYVGQSIDIKMRWLAHKEELCKNMHSNTHLQRAWNKYGECNFIFFVLEECDEAALNEKEQYWIDYYGGINSKNTYNQREAGSSGRLSDEVRQKISRSQKGVPESPGRTVSEAGRLSLSKSHMGIIPSEETRIKMSIAQKGRHHTEQSKQKIGRKNAQRYIDNPELRIEVSNRMKGRKVSEETRKKIGIASRGRKYGIETSKKHSESLKKAYREGRRKQVNITVSGVTKSQTEWADLIGVVHTSIIYQRKKGDGYVEKYIQEMLIKKNIKLQ